MEAPQDVNEALSNPKRLAKCYAAAKDHGSRPFFQVKKGLQRRHSLGHLATVSWDFPGFFLEEF